MTHKIFCIGFHKTGTTSLAEALTELGYRVTGPNGVEDPDIGHHVHALADELIPQFDAFQDNPWPLLYRRLDEQYPNSRFILTLRDPDSWIRSQVKHFGTDETPMRRWIYGADRGCPQDNEAHYLEYFNAHNQAVRDYFQDRPNDLLTLSLIDGDGWDKLCRFLDKPVPGRAFPHVNKAGDRDPRTPAAARPAASRGRQFVDGVKRRLGGR